MARRYPTIATAVTAFIAQACGLASGHDASGTTALAGSAGQGASLAGSGGQSSSGGSNPSGGEAPELGFGGGPVVDVPPECASAEVLFADQTVHAIGEQRIFYSWTTEEQVAELRAGGELFSRSERPGQGRGLLFTDLAELAGTPDAPEKALADALLNQTFAKARFAWPNPWATLLGLPGESYGDQLLRIELKPDAWIAKLDRQTLTVFDSKNQPVPLETALASPERIGAIYYQSTAVAGSAYCGTFQQGGVGFREFALGNLAMVARWSLATPEITKRLQSDLAALKAFEEQLACHEIPSTWSSDVSCDWGARGANAGGSLGNYDFALGLPSELYRPSPENISALIAALEASVPRGTPLDVTPGK